MFVMLGEMWSMDHPFLSHTEKGHIYTKQEVSQVPRKKIVFFKLQPFVVMSLKSSFR